MWKIIVVLFVVGCAHSAKDLSSNILIVNDQGGYGDHRVGLNDKNEAIVTETTPAAAELSVQHEVGLHFQIELEHESYMLKWCRRDSSDPRLGGDGRLPADSEVDNMRPVDRLREELGLDDSGNLKIVKSTFYTDKLAKERQYSETIQKMLKVVIRHKEECEFAMSQARRKAGLPGTRGFNEHFDNGLDVAFTK